MVSKKESLLVLKDFDHFVYVAHVSRWPGVNADVVPAVASTAGSTSAFTS